MSDKLDLPREKLEQLIQAAIDVRQRAYAKYSNFLVGAALLDDSDQTFCGCNVENASYGLTVCAERSAIFNAVSSGKRKFCAMALATSGGHLPCGACRQVLVEFCRELPLFICNTDQPETHQRVLLSELLPGRFSLDPSS